MWRKEVYFPWSTIFQGEKYMYTYTLVCLSVWAFSGRVLEEIQLLRDLEAANAAQNLTAWVAAIPNHNGALLPQTGQATAYRTRAEPLSTYLLTDWQSHVETAHPKMSHNGRKQPWPAVFADLYGRNIFTLANFELPIWCRWTWSWEEVWATSTWRQFQHTTGSLVVFLRPWI